MADTIPDTENTQKPMIWNMVNADERDAFTKFCHERKNTHGALGLVDDYEEARKEYALLENPKLLKNGTPPVLNTDNDNEGCWVFFPWRNIAVHTLAPDKFHTLRLSRNHDLITKEEQNTLSGATIAIAGLNVGNPGALCLVLEGIGKKFLMADNDTLSLSNLNRFRAGLCDVGVNKAVLSARQAYETNPFLDISVWENGITKECISEFVERSDIIIEEMDNLPFKIALREEAKRQQKPVIMVTGNGHDIILDVERFDREPDLPLLNAKLEQKVIDQIAAGPKSFDERIALAQDFMGSAYLSPRLNSSFKEVGKSLIGIPQLAEASFLRGAALAHATRNILLGEGADSGRYAFGLSALYRVKQ